MTSSTILPLSILSASLYLLLIPFFVFLSLLFIPLAILTTCVAVSTLAFRAALVYLELFAALVQQQLGLDQRQNKRHDSDQWPSEKTAAVTTSLKGSVPDPGSDMGSGIHQRIRRAERPLDRLESSTFRRTTANSISRQATKKFDNRSGPDDASFPLSRDYEGIGGWKTVEPSPANSGRTPGSAASSYIQYITINSRLELPDSNPITCTLPRVPRAYRQSLGRRHERSATAGPIRLPAPRSKIESFEISNIPPGSGRAKSMISLGDVSSEGTVIQTYEDEEDGISIPILQTKKTGHRRPSKNGANQRNWTSKSGGGSRSSSASSNDEPAGLTMR